MHTSQGLEVLTDVFRIRHSHSIANPSGLGKRSEAYVDESQHKTYPDLLQKSEDNTSPDIPWELCFPRRRTRALLNPLEWQTGVEYGESIKENRVDVRGAYFRTHT